MLCAIIRRPALAAAKCAKPGLPRRLAEAAGEDDRATAERSQAPGRLAADQKTAKAANPPEILELLRGQRAEIDALIVAGIEDDEVGWLAPIARRHRPIEKTNNVLLARRVRRYRFGVAAPFTDRLGDLLDLIRRPACDEHVITLGCKVPAERRAKPALGANANYDGSGRA
jgi:hypothetical protein